MARLSYVPPYYPATVCVGLGRADEALELPSYLRATGAMGAIDETTASAALMKGCG
jgi:hypothetical protein